MNLTEEFIVRSMIKTLEKHLLGVLSSQYRDSFAKAKKEFIDKKMCQSMSLNIMDESNLIVNIDSKGIRYVLVWDTRKKKIHYSRRRKIAQSKTHHPF